MDYNARQVGIGYGGGSYGNGGITWGNARNLPNPFADIASLYLPTSIYDCFELMEYLMTTMPPFMSVTQRVVRYFLTNLNISGSAGQHKESYENFFLKGIKVMDSLGNIGADLQTYGNSFVSLYLPFDRVLICPKCGTRYMAKQFPYRFDPTTMTFSGKCRKCRENVKFERKDLRSGDESQVRLIRWNPKRIQLRVHPVSGKTEYFLKLDQSKLVRHIVSGDPIDRFYIDDSPWSFIETCCANIGVNTPLYKFDDEGIYHSKTTALAGIEMYGWGMPPMLPYFKLAYYIQLMRRYDEAIAMDFIVPFRVIYPQMPQGANQDALSLMSMQHFVRAMQAMVERKRKNLTDVQISPFPIGYQMMGGEGKQMVPKDLLQEAMSELLNALGYPEELYKGSLTVQAAPLALRLFERHWQYLVDAFNGILSWITKTVTRHFSWDDIDVELQPITLADDLERKSLLVQLASAGVISQETALGQMGINFISEQKKITTEQQKVQAIQQRATAAQQASMLNGDAGVEEGGEGAPAPAGGMSGSTPTDMESMADTYAQQIVGMDALSRRRALLNLDQHNPTLHALVKQKIEKMESEMSSQGVQMGRAQMQAQGAPQ